MMVEVHRKLRCLGFAALLTLAASTALAQNQISPACGAPTALDDGWAIASPESAGMDAARLCGIAGPGEVLVDEATLAKLGDRAVTESKGSLQLKGLSAPVAAFRLQEVRT